MGYLSNNLRRGILLISCLLAFCFQGKCQGKERPKIISFEGLNDPKTKQVWNIAQNKKGVLYLATTGGMVEYDGANWHQYQLPHQQTVRSLAINSKDQLFVGGFEEFGYWKKDPTEKLVFQSLKQLLPEPDLLYNEEIWHILVDEDTTYFQSFSVLFKYYEDNLQVIDLPGNIMFIRKVNHHIIVPILNQGLFQLNNDGSYQLLKGSELFIDKQIEFILPLKGKDFLIGTKDHGLFVFKKGKFTTWNKITNQQLKQYQVNRGQQLSNGNLAIGTVLKGIFILNQNGRILYNFDQQSGLKNNTVLSLLESQRKNLWIGLDKGINLLKINDPILYFQDNLGVLGTIYKACTFNSRLYLGTNQGVFYRNIEGSNETFKLIEGTQGQVWDLQVIDQQIICGHNQGTFSIKDNKAQKISSFNGGWKLVPIPNQKNLYLQGVYAGLVLYEKNKNNELVFKHRLGGYNTSSQDILFDKKHRLWAVHPTKGIYRLEPNSNWDHIDEMKDYSVNKGLPNPYNLSLTSYNDFIYVKSGGQYFRYVESIDSFTQVEAIEGIKVYNGEDLLQIGPEEYFKVFGKKVHWQKVQNKAILDVSLVESSKSIIDLNEKYYLFCLIDGYGLLKKNLSLKEASAPPANTFVTSFSTDQKIIYSPDSQKIIAVGPQEKELTFYFTSSAFGQSINYSFFLDGYSSEWSDFQPSPFKSFTNLPYGEYTFFVKTDHAPDQLAKLTIYKQPWWYETLFARIIFGIALLGLLLTLYQWHKFRLKQQTIRIEKEKEKQLQEERIKLSNEQLQNDILRKSRELVNSTANLVKKNELLLQIKEELEPSKIPPAIDKVRHLIDSNIKNEEDWSLFENNFEEVHEQFLKRLKDQYAELTPGDLRLAALLKMNLTTKEIAPLLNISIRGVENKRYRLRKKIGLEGEDNLNEFMMQF